MDKRVVPPCEAQRFNERETSSRREASRRNRKANHHTSGNPARLRLDFFKRYAVTLNVSLEREDGTDTERGKLSPLQRECNLRSKIR